MGNSLAKAAAVDVGIQWCCWVLAAALKTEKFYDLAGSGTFFALAYQSLRWGGTYHTRQKVQTGMVMTWAARLGLYLFSRVLQDGRDRRFNNVRDRPGVFFIYWTLQAVWVFSTLLPTLMLNSKKDDKPLTTRDYIGWGLWGLGFFFEVVADYQKSQFKANPENAGRFINQGLWSLSRHPNYFGEILMWSGLYVSASSVLSGWEHISVISPLFLSYLLINVSGIPMLEAYGRKKWGAEPAYQEYVRNTAKLIPFIW
ncbi:hypothetical protein BaRGS_00015549 [Batillaria attramentaria]|uniref:Steroid 5-alpha reductase C-terminal domain-containing protein n=1 Tax=Batillaria attramentaria TaxID=370345 RepID=A0ABD0L2C4_9CAEN